MMARKSASLTLIHSLFVLSEQLTFMLYTLSTVSHYSRMFSGNLSLESQTRNAEKAKFFMFSHMKMLLNFFFLLFIVQHLRCLIKRQNTREIIKRMKKKKIPTDLMRLTHHVNCIHLFNGKCARETTFEIMCLLNLISVLDVGEKFDCCFEQHGKKHTHKNNTVTALEL